jgi:hypothetical protein
MHSPEIKCQFFESNNFTNYGLREKPPIVAFTPAIIANFGKCHALGKDYFTWKILLLSTPFVDEETEAQSD